MAREVQIKHGYIDQVPFRLPYSEIKHNYPNTFNLIHRIPKKERKKERKRRKDNIIITK